MLKYLIICFICFLAFYVSGQERLYDLIVRVENVKSKDGNLAVGLFKNPQSFLEEAAFGKKQSISESTVTVKYQGLEKGTYAVSIFHDRNGNGELDANLFGIPKEPYAFSNNAKGMFGPPSFQDCQFEVSSGRNEIVITL